MINLCKIHNNQFLFIAFIIYGLFLFNTTQSQSYAIGADLSFVAQAEKEGFVFKENNTPKSGLTIFKDHGYNWIRLRLFHSPDKLPNNLEYTIELAKQAKKLGFKFLLDYHYSDIWADPQHQILPKAWTELSHDVLVDSVYAYTLSTMNAFKEADVYPDMVQNGNEIINGMMWPDGKIPENWDNLAELIQAGIDGVKASADDMRVPQIMIHIDQGGNLEKSKYFYDKIFSYGIDFDVIGQSYYPWWHGNLLQLRENMNFMANTYKKPIILVEVAYCSEPTEYKDNSGPFAESPDGQRAFLEAINDIVLHIPNNLGIGIFWWEPAVGHRPGITTRDMFDAGGNVLPVINVFDKFTRK